MLRYIYSFKLLSRLTTGLYNTEMHTHAGFSDPLSLQSIIKPRIVRYVGRLTLYRQHPGFLEEEKE